MKVYTYHTNGGKDLIRTFLDNLPQSEGAEGYYIIEQLEAKGIEFMRSVNTRQLEGKLWEIKFQRHNRIMYILIDADQIIYYMPAKSKKIKLKKLIWRRRKQELRKFCQIVQKRNEVR